MAVKVKPENRGKFTKKAKNQPANAAMMKHASGKMCGKDDAFTGLRAK